MNLTINDKGKENQALMFSVLNRRHYVFLEWNIQAQDSKTLVGTVFSERSC